MKKVAIFALLVALSAAPIASAAEQPPPAESKDPNAPTYQSPILSLLFLPVNLLIKMASVMGPPSAEKSSATQTSPHGADK